MIDCSKTETYFIEKKRMLKATESTVCRVGCVKCPLSAGNNNKGICCTDFEVLYSEKAIAIVQKWSNAHHKIQICSRSQTRKVGIDWKCFRVH